MINISLKGEFQLIGRFIYKNSHHQLMLISDISQNWLINSQLSKIAFVNHFTYEQDETTPIATP